MLSMKTILVPMENHDAMQSALETALLLARPFGSYIEGFALRWEINEFGGGDIAGAFPLATYREDIAEEAKQARQIFESFMQKHDVPRATGTTVSLSFGWLDEVPEGESFVGSYGRVFDVIVTEPGSCGQDRWRAVADRRADAQGGRTGWRLCHLPHGSPAVHRQADCTGHE